jgi:hypothetical protein
MHSSWEAANGMRAHISEPCLVIVVEQKHGEALAACGDTGLSTSA